MDKVIGLGIALVLLYFLFYLIVGIGYVVFVIPTYIFFYLYIVLEFVSTNILIALDKIFYPGFNAPPIVVWAFWGLVIGAAIQGYREMRVYGQKKKGVLIVLAPVALLVILKLISPPRPGSIEVHADDHSNTRSGASSLALGGSHVGQIRPSGDIDYFKVQVSKSGVLTVYTTGSLNTMGALQDSSGTTVAHDNDATGSGSNFKIERPVPAGTYYVIVYSTSAGNYIVHARFSLKN